MKKLYYLGALAGLILTSCANDDLIDNQATNSVPNDGAIAFNMRLNNQTRVGVGLETVMHNFGVFAIKASGDDDNVWTNDLKLGEDDMNAQVVMNNYKVQYDENVERYGSHWNYEGVVGKGPKAQFLKYWDGSYNYTYFFPYAPFNANVAFDGVAKTLTLQNVETTTTESDVFVYADVTKSTNAKYIVDYAAGATTPEGYPNPTTPGALNNDNPLKVPLQFHRGMSKLQIAFHENIPGYSVTMAELSLVANGEQAAANGAYVAAIPADFDDTKAVGETGRWTRGSYVNSGEAVVAYSGTNFGTTTLSYNSAQTSSANFEFAMPTNATIGTSHDTKTFSPTVYNVIPNAVDDGVDVMKDAENAAAVNSGLQFVLNYTLKSEDTNEVINVKGARVFVTPEYTAWKANTVYTYVFLITRTSSGTTTNTDPINNPADAPDALYPIIFDGVQIANMETNNSEWILNGLQLSETNVTLDVDGKKKLTASVDGTPCPNVLWGTNNSNIATVSNEGEITAVGAGVTVITAKVTDSSGVEYTATCVVSVKGIKLTGDATDAMNVDDTVTLGVTKIAVTGDVTWESSDTNVATVENGEVTAVAAGTATITATLGSYTATREVTVQ